MEYLQKLLDPQLIQLNIEVSSFSEAIQKSFVPFLRKGFIEQKYIYETEKAYQESGPYFAFTKGTALPHCDDFTSVKKSALGITVLKKAVRSGSQANDPIRILLPLCTVDSQSHLNALSQLADVLSDKKRMERIISSESINEVYHLITGGKYE